jgi:hypothetical protein
MNQIEPRMTRVIDPNNVCKEYLIPCTEAAQLYHEGKLAWDRVDKVYRPRHNLPPGYYDISGAFLNHKEPQ